MIVGSLVCGASFASRAHAEPAPASGAPWVRELRYDARVDLPIVAVGAVGWIGSELLKGKIAPASCRWCDRDADGTDRLNALDSSVRGLRWSSPKTADTLSNVTLFFALPVGLLGFDAVAANHDGRVDGFAVDALVIVEATVLAADVNQVVKFFVSRERPFVHALPPDQKGSTDHPNDNNLSFFSGHATGAFALAVSAGTVSSMRGYRWAPIVWASGLTLAATTSYLRIAADKHYFTDVMLGMLVGSGFGFAIPYVFHRPKGAKGAHDAVSALTIAPLANGQGAVLSGSF